jgi:hypothetical protein
MEKFIYLKRILRKEKGHLKLRDPETDGTKSARNKISLGSCLLL